MAKIVVLDAKTLGNIDLSLWHKLGEVVIYPTTKPEETIERIKNADVIITNKVVIDQKMMENSPKLKLICVAATGTNNIDLKAAQKLGIAVTNVAGYSTRSVAQHTFAMLFYLLESLNYYDNYVKSSRYSKNDIFTHLDKPFYEISGKRWGIIGLGTIGKEVAKIAEAFGCEVVYYSTSGVMRKEPYPRVSLDVLLTTSDIVSIHAPLNERTKNLITYEKLKLMKRNAVILNLGRGGIINEKDLAKALDEGLISAAALDVLEKEPIEPDNPLLKIKNKERLLITPHIAWASIEARKRLVYEIYENIKAFFEGRKRNRLV